MRFSTTQHLAVHARRQPDAVAIARQGSTLTYGQLADLTVRYVDMLRDIPVGPGSRVGIECDNRLVHLLIMLACANIGATTISLVRGDLQEANAFYMGCDFIFTQTEGLPATGPRRQLIRSDWVARIEGRRLHADWTVLDRPSDADAVGRIVRTSGTSGSAKAMALTNRFLHDVVAQYGTDVNEHIPSPPRFIVLYALTAQFACNRIAMCIRMGGSAILSTPASFGTDIVRYGANGTMLLVGDAEKIAMQLPASFPKPPAFALATVGASLSPRLRAALLEKLASHIVDIYATNETGRISVTDADGVGRAAPGVSVAIVDEAGNDKPYGETGLIKVKSPTMVTGYLGDPELSASTFVGGWFHSNDIGRMPAPDRLIVVGRADDLLNIGGLKIAPGPVEDELRAVPGVRDAAAVEVSSFFGGGTLAFAIERTPGTDPERLKAAIAQAVGHRYSRFHVTILDALPRTEHGKIRRRDVEESFRRRLGVKA